MVAVVKIQIFGAPAQSRWVDCFLTSARPAEDERAPHPRRGDGGLIRTVDVEKEISAREEVLFLSLSPPVDGVTLTSDLLLVTGAVHVRLMLSFAAVGDRTASELDGSGKLRRSPSAIIAMDSDRWQ